MMSVKIHFVKSQGIYLESHGTKMFPETAWKSIVSPNCCENVPGFFQSVPEYLIDTLIKTGDEKNYVWTKVPPNPSRIHKTTKNMILYKNLMFIFSLIPSFSRYSRSKNDYARLSCRISFMKTCSPYASVSANLSKICTFLWPISVAKKCSARVSAPISSSVLNNVSLKYPYSVFTPYWARIT